MALENVTSADATSRFLTWISFTLSSVNSSPGSSSGRKSVAVAQSPTGSRKVAQSSAGAASTITDRRQDAGVVSAS